MVQKVFWSSGGNRSRDQETFSLPGTESTVVLLFFRYISVRVSDDQRVPCLSKYVFRSPNKAREKWIGYIGNDHADRSALPGTEPPGNRVGAIPRFSNNPENMLS